MSETRWFPAERALFLAAVTIAAALPPTLLAAALDPREFLGVDPWFKPLKFQASTVVYFLTLVFVARRLSERARSSLAFRVSAVAGSISGMFEIAYISIQAGRLRASHYNFATDFESSMYTAMGVGALAMLWPALTLGILCGPRESLAPGIRAGFRLALVVGAVAVLVTAGVLASRDGHWVGGVRDDAGGLPFLGWSRTGGDLRVAHFLSLHTLQVLPLVGWLADRVAPARARQVTVAAAVGWVAVIAWTFAQALAARPLVTH